MGTSAPAIEVAEPTKRYGSSAGPGRLSPAAAGPGLVRFRVAQADPEVAHPTAARSAAGEAAD
jgi:hypothetical protein